QGSFLFWRWEFAQAPASRQEALSTKGERGGPRSFASNSGRYSLPGKRSRATAMRPIPLDDETRALAARLIWFEPPAEALADPIRFIAYALARATHEDMKILRRYV